MSIYRGTLDRAAACTTTEEALSLVNELTSETLVLRPELLHEEARVIVMENIGYITGYLDRAEAGRLLGLFGTRHPLFGAIEDWPKTPEETIAMGMKVGERLKQKSAEANPEPVRKAELHVKQRVRGVRKGVHHG